MLDRLVERFCELDDFCRSIRTQWEAMLLADGKAPARKHGPESGLADSEIMTLLVLYHSSRFKNFKTFYDGIVLKMLSPYFPGAPCYERFLTLTKRVWALLGRWCTNSLSEKGCLRISRIWRLWKRAEGTSLVPGVVERLG